MKSIITLLFIAAGASASAIEVSVKCTAKAFACYNLPSGPECRWTEVGNSIVSTVLLDQDKGRPEIWHGLIQKSLDGHLLTLNFRYNEDKRHNPLRVKAYLATANVMAESSGVDSVDIALRNNTYGRGFNCEQIHPN